MREMKDSGIEWIGAMPRAWKMNTIAQIFLQVKCKNTGLQEKNLLSLSYGKVKRKSIDTVEGLLPESFDGYNIIEKDDIVLRLTDLQNDHTSLRVGLAEERGIITSAYLTIRNRSNFCPKYLYYYLHSFDIAKGFYGMGAGVRQGLNWDGVKWLKILAPLVPEQERIAAFLDAECAEIDAVLEKTSASIEEYKKLKQAVITQAVTKGIRGDRPMKDSGIEWIGEIPAEWDVVRQKYFWNTVESGVSVNAADKPVDNSEQYGVLKTSAVSKFVFIPTEHKQVNLEEYGRVSCPVKADSIIASRMNTPELVGACGYVQNNYPNLFLPDRLWQITFKDGLSPKYAWYYLSGIRVRQYISSLSTGTSSSMQNISQSQYGNIFITIPSVEEQSEITKYLDEKCRFVDALVTKKQQYLTEVENYKKSLIYEYVTGKKEVKTSVLAD